MRVRRRASAHAVLNQILVPPVEHAQLGIALPGEPTAVLGYDATVVAVGDHVHPRTRGIRTGDDVLETVVRKVAVSGSERAGQRWLGFGNRIVQLSGNLPHCRTFIEYANAPRSWGALAQAQWLWFIDTLYTVARPARMRCTWLDWRRASSPTYSRGQVWPSVSSP